MPRQGRVNGFALLRLTSPALFFAALIQWQGKEGGQDKAGVFEPTIILKNEIDEEKENAQGMGPGFQLKRGGKQ